MLDCSEAQSFAAKDPSTTNEVTGSRAEVGSVLEAIGVFKLSHWTK